MAKIPADLSVKPATNPASMGVPLGKGRGAETYAPLIEGGNVLQQISRTTGDIAEKYMVKNKRADMMADEAKYMTFKKQTLLNATKAAAKTTDSKEVDKIYTEAQTQIDKYANESTDGVANIRWEDQKGAIKGDASQFRVTLAGENYARNASISKAVTTATAKQTMNDGMLTLDYDMMGKAPQIMVASGDMTPEEAAIWRDESIHSAEKIDAQNRTKQISGMDPVTAKATAIQYSKDVDLYKNLSENEKKTIRSDFQKAIRTAERNQIYVDKARNSAVQARSRAQAENNLVSVSASDGDFAKQVNVVAEKDPELAGRMVAGRTQRMEMNDPADPVYRTSSDWYKWSSKVRAYNKAADKDGSVLNDLMIEAYSFGEYGDRSLDMLHRKVTGIGGGKMTPDEQNDLFYYLQDKIDDAATEAGHGKVRNKVPAEYRDTMERKDYGDTIEYSSMDALSYALVMEQASGFDFTLEEAKRFVDENPLFRRLSDDTDLIRFNKNRKRIRLGL